MTYTKAQMCVLCKEPTSLCQCPDDVRAFGDVHIHTHDGERALIDGETLRVLIERALGWGKLMSEKALSAAPEAAAMTWQPIESSPDDGMFLVLTEKYGACVARRRLGWDGLFTVPGQYCIYPTHWMPLPLLPQPQ